MIWECILCSTRNYRKAELHRESMLCRKCRSTWRARAIGLAVQQGLGYEIQPYKTILSDWSRVGLGISDDVSVSVALHSKFFYSNSYYDTFPFLDIRDIPERARNCFEFVTCSVVLEHIDKGISEAFQGLQSLVRSGGFVVVSVPITGERGHSEFYMDLDQFELEPDGVHWVNSNGARFVDNSPEFHGGRGQNLAFRQFSAASLINSLNSAGFSHVIDLNYSPELGVPELEFPGVVIARC